MPHETGPLIRTDGNATVRPASLDDLEFVSRVGNSKIPTEVARRKIECHEVVVAERDGESVGFLRLEYLWSKIPYVAAIWVLEEHRRHGVGRAMLDYVEALLREQGHEMLYSSSQADEPEPQAWHRHVGFEECGVIAGINQGGIGEVFFRKGLI